MLVSGAGEEWLTLFTLQSLDQVRNPEHHSTESLGLYRFAFHRQTSATTADVTCWGWESASSCCCCCSAGGCPPRSGRRWYRSGTPGERRKEPTAWFDGPPSLSRLVCVPPFLEMTMNSMVGSVDEREMLWQTQPIANHFHWDLCVHICWIEKLKKEILEEISVSWKKVSFNTV